MITISVKPVINSTRSETCTPRYAVSATPPTPTTVHSQTGTVIPYSAATHGVSTVLAMYENTRVGANGSHKLTYQPAKNPARGCSERAIHVYQPPAEGNTRASSFTESASGSSMAPASK